MDSRGFVFWAFFLESAFLLWIATPCCRKTRDDNRGLVWHTARDDRKGALCEKVDSRICVFVCVDCHATADAVSRNDSVLDSSAMDSRIVELESGLFVLFGGVELLAVGFG